MTTEQQEQFTQVVSNTTTNPEQPPAQAAAPAPQETTNSTRPTFTEEDIARVRREEKAKLYDELEKLRGETKQLMEDKQERERLAAEAAQQQAAEEQKRREEELSVRELLQKKEIEWQQQLEAERRERERALAELEKEKQLLALQQYRTQVIDQNRDEILPELLDLVGGNSREEIEASVAGLKERSTRILASAQQASQMVRRDSAGTRVTSPSSEQLESYPGSASVTPDQIRDMSMQEYAKYRESLLGGNPSQGQGLFG